MVNTSSYEDRPTLPSNIRQPMALGRAPEVAVHSMEDISLIDTLHIQNPFHAIHFLWVALDDLPKERVQPVLIQSPSKLHAQRLDFWIMDMIILVVKKSRIEFQGLVERECFHITQLIHGNRNLRILQVHGQDLGKWIHMLQTLQHVAQFHL